MKIEEMPLDDFLDWATGYFLTELGGGERVRMILYTIVTQALQNKRFNKRRIK